MSDWSRLQRIELELMQVHTALNAMRVERDTARSIAVALEQELTQEQQKTAELIEALDETTRALDDALADVVMVPVIGPAS